MIPGGITILQVGHFAGGENVEKLRGVYVQSDIFYSGDGYMYIHRRTNSIKEIERVGIGMD